MNIQRFSRFRELAKSSLKRDFQLNSVHSVAPASSTSTSSVCSSSKQRSSQQTSSPLRSLRDRANASFSTRSTTAAGAPAITQAVLSNANNEMLSNTDSIGSQLGLQSSNGCDCSGTSISMGAFHPLYYMKSNTSPTRERDRGASRSYSFLLNSSGLHSNNSIVKQYHSYSMKNSNSFHQNRSPTLTSVAQLGRTTSNRSSFKGATFAYPKYMTVKTNSNEVCIVSTRSISTTSSPNNMESNDDGSHDDFKKVKKSQISDLDEAIEMIKEQVQAHDILLYMKGTPSRPQCGFSAQVVKVLHASGTDFDSVNVLDYPLIREGIKQYSDWPTIPQLYIGGEFVGGCDIVTAMFQSGELSELLEQLTKK